MGPFPFILEAGARDLPPLIHDEGLYYKTEERKEAAKLTMQRRGWNLFKFR